ncbi:bifunctional diguanylate cyclase/phosphodiesterase [uncultured Thiodictyon sp.]|uniref:putative bifunctional diguanylate cyclase/phosphodiesterase n=1 Tax=uncultured Thiodictyon sp. TaxID=1846217 RepID=UPI0025E8AAC5|nr:bifunctional diguanylate cyclase/phosphodiesterase [uncultured Thiodictyon sp.]
MTQAPALDPLAAENEALRARLAEAEETLRAIRNGEVDALVVSGSDGDHVFTLQGADYPYRVLVEEMSEGAIILTAEGVIFYANRRLAEMLKTPLEQVIGSACDRWIAPADAAPFRALLNRTSAPSRQRMELTLRASDGTNVPCYLSVSCLLIGEVLGSFCVVATDLTEQKRSEAILAAEKLARLILDQTAEAIVVCDNASRIIRASAVAYRLCGEDPLDQPFERAFALERPDGAGVSLADLLRVGEQRRVEAKLERRGEFFHLVVSVGPLVGPLGDKLGSVVTLTDITQRKAAEEQIERLAFYDPLTRLPNRRRLLERLHQAVETGARSRRPGALMFIDLDNFKVLNDTLGHDVGDLLLQQAAGRLLDCVRESDTVARLGGDEFVVMLEGLGERAEAAAAKAQDIGVKVLAALNEPYQLADHRCHSTASLGITLIADHQTPVEDLLKQADLAMYQAKAAGRNTLRFFNPDMQAALEARSALETQLRDGLRDGQFLLYYQAQVDDAGSLTGAEALVRWQHPQRGLITPYEFIPLAEETGLILPLGHWVLESACGQLAAWAHQPQRAHLTLAVNVSARQFRDPGFVDQVRTALAASGADPHRLKLELTESLLLEDVTDTIAKMTALKSLGLGFSLDDFGTGYSSLSYLKRLPLDQLKIDQSFVRDALDNPNDAAIVRAILALAPNLNLTVIAEGVETQAQRAFLIENGCRAFQGYLFGRPGPAAALP